jgi:hypothetical protein
VTGDPAEKTLQRVSLPAGYRQAIISAISSCSAFRCCYCRSALASPWACAEIARRVAGSPRRPEAAPKGRGSHRVGSSSLTGAAAR